jgi:hypothetical protein
MKSEIRPDHLATGTLGSPTYSASTSLSPWTFPNPQHSSVWTIIVGLPAQLRAGVCLPKAEKVVESAGDTARVTTWNVLRSVYPNLVTAKDWIHRDEIVSSGLTRAWEDYDSLRGALMCFEGDTSVWPGGFGPSEVWIGKRQKVNGSLLVGRELQTICVWIDESSNELLTKGCDLGVVRGINYVSIMHLVAVRGASGSGIWDAQSRERLVWLPCDSKGLGVHTDLTIEPRYGKLFGLVDQTGRWQVRHLNGTTNENLNEIAISGTLLAVIDEASINVEDENETAFNQDGWARLNFILDGNALLLCSRTQIQVVSIKLGQIQPINLWKQQRDSWILDVNVSKQSPYIFVLTNNCIYWIHLEDDGLHKVLLVVRHNHNPVDLGIQMKLLETENCTYKGRIFDRPLTLD